MYPEDQTPHNTLGEPPKPATFGPPEGGRNRKQPFNAKPLLWAGGIFLLVLLLVAGIVWVSSLGTSDKGTDKTATTTDKPEEEEESKSTDPEACTAKQRRYQNRDLSLGFCYPNVWGNVSVADAEFDPSDDGTRLKLSFSAKPQVNIGLVSDDWSTDVARDGVCSDPAQQELPNFESFSARWATEGSGASISSATRGLEIATDEYIIEEYVDNLLTNGVCLTGFKLTEGEVYRHVEASYSAAFSAEITTPQAHINDPTVLVPVADRTAFIALVKSFRKE